MNRWDASLASRISSVTIHHCLQIEILRLAHLARNLERSESPIEEKANLQLKEVEKLNIDHEIRLNSAKKEVGDLQQALFSIANEKT